METIKYFDCHLWSTAPRLAPSKEIAMSAVHQTLTLDSPQAQAQRQAYNLAFEELGLNWSWDPDTFACLPDGAGERVRFYLEREQPHLLRAYDADFLVNAVECARQRWQAPHAR
jgi:hypothetical protein